MSGGCAARVEKQIFLPYALSDKNGNDTYGAIERKGVGVLYFFTFLAVLKDTETKTKVFLILFARPFSVENNAVLKHARAYIFFLTHTFDKRSNNVVTEFLSIRF